MKMVRQIGLSSCMLLGVAMQIAPAQDMRVGQTAPPQQVSLRTEILNLDSWTVTCSEFADKTKRCSALLQILQQNTGQVVFTWTVGMDDHKQLVMVMQVPTGVLITPGVELRIGKLPPQKIPFTSCEPGRCVASLPIDANLLKEMTASQTAEALIQATQGNAVQFNIQMKGFDRAYAALK